MAASVLDMKKTCFVGALLRLLFMCYGEWQDKTMEVKYTDVDYKVFTDAARHIVNGNSPYRRATYRYTPLLAMVLVPNVTLYRAFGKLLFVFCDILAAYLIYLILKTQKLSETSAVKYSWFWIFNPMIITVSTRGNAESLLAVLVLSTLYFTLNKHFALSAITLALSVHFKIYPIIYSLPLYLTIGWLVKEKNAGKSAKKNRTLEVIFSHLNHPHQLLYAFLSGMTFFLINVTMYYIYGFEFLEHTYLYHATRKDVKHNFSVYFYMLYLTMDTSFSWLISVLAFLPQFLLVLMFAVKYYKDLLFCCFVQTFAFVTFNKVCTTQYFLWYLTLLPLLLPRLQIKLTKALMMLFAWCVSQALWLGAAYLLEFQGYNTLLLVWASSVNFFAVNIWILCTLIVNHSDLENKKCS